MNLDIPLGQGLEDCEHHALLSQGGRILDFQRFGELEKLGRFLFLQSLERHVLQAFKKSRYR